MNDDFEIESVMDLDAAWPALETLLRDSFEYYQDIVGYGPPPDWLAEFQGRLRPGPEALLLLARRASEPVAYANALLRTAPGSPPQRHVYVDNVYVVAAARAAGVGSAILTRIEGWARERGAGGLRLDVLAANDLARSFWSRRGFEPHAYELSKPLAPEAAS